MSTTIGLLRCPETKAHTTAKTGLPRRRKRIYSGPETRVPIDLLRGAFRVWILRLSLCCIILALAAVTPC